MSRTQEGASSAVLAAQALDASPAAGQSLHEYVADHYDTLMERLRHYLGCPDLAADTLHDTWLKLAQGQTSGTTITNPGGYVFRIACNLAADRRRRERIGGIHWADEAELENLPDDAPGPFECAAARATLDALHDAFQSLSRRQQAVCQGVWVDDLPRCAVATRFGISKDVLARELRDARAVCVHRLAAAGNSVIRTRLPPRVRARSRHAGYVYIDAL